MQHTEQCHMLKSFFSAEIAVWRFFRNFAMHMTALAHADPAVRFYTLYNIYSITWQTGLNVK